MIYKTFYTCYSTGLEASEDTITQNELKNFAFNILRNKDDFFGLVDAEDNTLQFMVEDTNKIWMEIPTPTKKGSYGKHINVDEFSVLIDNLKPFFRIEDFTNMEFVSW